MLSRSRDLCTSFQTPLMGAEIDWGHPLTRNLVACYPLWGADLEMDYARRGNNLTNNGRASVSGVSGDSVVLGTSKAFVGNSCHFVAASTQYLSGSGSNPDLQTGNIDWTISFWISSGPLNHMLVAKLGAANASREYQIYMGGVGNNFIVMDWWLNATGSTANVLGTGAMSSVNWALAFVWHDAKANNINIQTFHAATRTYSTIATTAATGGNTGTATFTIGRQSDLVGTYFGGNLANIQIRKQVLTLQEREWLFAEPYPFFRRPVPRVYSIPAAATSRSFAVIVG